MSLSVDLKSILDSQIKEILIRDAGWSRGQHPIGRADSLDLRECIVAATAAGDSCPDVALIFKVSVADVVKSSQRFHASKTAERLVEVAWKRIGALLTIHAERMRQLVRQYRYDST